MHSPAPANSVAISQTISRSKRNAGVKPRTSEDLPQPDAPTTAVKRPETRYQRSRKTERSLLPRNQRASASARS